jgi:hypothetical protein
VRFPAAEVLKRNTPEKNHMVGGMMNFHSQFCRISTQFWPRGVILKHGKLANVPNHRIYLHQAGLVGVELQRIA